MNKNRFLSWLAASAIFVSALAPLPMLAEGDGTYPEGFSGGTQYDFITVPSDGNVMDYLDVTFDGNETPESEENEGGAASTPGRLPASPTPIPSVPAGSGFEMDGKALIRYYGNEALVSVPEGVTVIRGGAFAGNTSVVTVYLPDSVEEIQGNAFENCSKLQTVVTSGNSKLHTIGAYAFAGCKRLNITFALDVENVSPKAFPPELVATPTPTASPTPKPTPTMKATPAKPSSPYDSPVPDSTAYAGSLKIIRQPVSVYADAGDFVSFIVLAEGTGAIRYQWMRSKDGENWVRIETSSRTFENAATNVLSFTATAARAAYRFKCVVSDGINTLESDVVSVIMNTQGGPSGPDAEDPWEETWSPQIPEGHNLASVPYIWARQISNSSAIIKWTQMQGAVGYELYRYTLSDDENRDEEFILIGTFADTSYTDTGLDLSRNKYSYSVKAVLAVPLKGEAVTTDYSNAAEVETVAAPAAVSAVQESDTSVRITWNPSPNADSFTVTRSTDGVNFDIVAQSITESEYVDQNLDLLRNTYWYQVVAQMNVPGSDEPIRKTSAAVKVQENYNFGRELVMGNFVFTITPDGAVLTAYNGDKASVKIPPTIQHDKYTVVGIGPNVFWGNKTVKKIILPDTIRVIETGAFAYCSAIIDQ